jgi:transposase
MRYELTDHEWAAIKPMLPNNPRGVPRVNDRRWAFPRDCHSVRVERALLSKLLFQWPPNGANASPSSGGGR